MRTETLPPPLNAFESTYTNAASVDTSNSLLSSRNNECKGSNKFGLTGRLLRLWPYLPDLLSPARIDRTSLENVQYTTPKARTRSSSFLKQSVLQASLSPNREVQAGQGYMIAQRVVTQAQLKHARLFLAPSAECRSFGRFFWKMARRRLSSRQCDIRASRLWQAKPISYKTKQVMIEQCQTIIGPSLGIWHVA